MLTLLKSFTHSMMYVLTLPLNGASNSYPNGIDVPYVNKRLLKIRLIHILFF